MIERYSMPEMAKIWSEENRFQKMLDVELAVCEALNKKRTISDDEFKKIKEKVKLNIPRIKEIEEKTKHDIAAFVDQLSENLGKESRWIHFGLTSSDVLDTTNALQLKNSCELLIKKLVTLKTTIKKLALKHKKTLMIGRTHGVHAEPITFGFKLLGWYSEITRHTEMLKATREHMSYGKISGAVGTFAHIEPEIEEYVCKKLGLKPEPVSTQIVPRDRYAVYLCRLAIVASSIERFAIEIRSLQRTEIRELEESFSKGQKGSSAMPHKKNPITSEQLCGLARVIRGNSIAGLENVALWHERDISHSSVERIILPDSSILLDYMLEKFNRLMENIVVYPENMRSNIEKSRDVFFSQVLMLELIKKGLTRNEAYRVVQGITQSVLNAPQDASRNFKYFVMADDFVRKHLSEKEIERCFNINYFVRNIPKIYKRVGI
ncbi:MAG: adenylosuccinate lyase [Elusimicrobiota bacterium]